MQDKLKQYIEDHREEFEVHEPREYLWDGVDDRLQQGRRGIRWQRLAIAASLLLVITCGTWIFVANKHNSANDTTAQTHPPIAETEAYFTSIVQMKDAELEQYCRPQPELCKEFERDLEDLNKAYHQLKKEYPSAADKQKILKAMTTNLQMQVQLISSQLQIMEAVKQKKEEIKFI